MKRCLFVFLLSVLSFALHAASAYAPNTNWSLEGLSGETLSQADLVEGSTVMVVWASWSPRCRDIVERVKNLEEEWATKTRVVSVVFQEDREQIESFLQDQSLDTPIFVDETGRFSKQNAVTTLPALLIFNDGELAFRGRLPTDPGPTIAKTLG